MNSEVIVTSRDVQDIFTRLSSDKPKLRDEGIKLLNIWLAGDRSPAFCTYLTHKSSLLKPNELLLSETWPFLVKLLIHCVSLEISSSKKRLPKITHAKALRVVVQKAVDKHSGKKLVLLPVAKLLFNHIWDVLKDIPSFQSEYGLILRDLLAIKDYKFHLRKRVYLSLVLLLMEKVNTSLLAKNSDQIYRFSSTLLSLLETPPGDFPDGFREDVIKGFVGIFDNISSSAVSNDGKFSRRLLECVNIFLLKDGPNLGCKSLEIHDVVKEFVFGFWFETHDKSLKDSLVSYAKLQLCLTRGADDGAVVLEQFLDVLIKELDLMCDPITNHPRTDSTRDEKRGLLTSSQLRVVDLGAVVFCRACTNTSKLAITEKRARQEHLVVQIKERLVEGKWSWHAVVFYLIRNYAARLKKDILIYWFENISENIQRIINTANSEHSYDGLLWTLRSLQGLSSLLFVAVPRADSSQKSLTSTNEPLQVEKACHVIWNCLVHVLPMFVNIPIIVDASLRILCNILLSDTKDSFAVSLEMWDLQVFKHSPSISVLCFISCYFSRRASQCNPNDALYTRRTMLRAILSLLSLKKSLSLNERLIVVVPAAAYAVCDGSAPLLSEALGPLVNLSDHMDEVVKADELSTEYSREIFECSVEVLAKIDEGYDPQVSLSEHSQHVRLPRTLRDELLHEMESYIVECLKDKESEMELLSEIIGTCALLSNFMYCSYSTRIKDETCPFYFSLGKLILAWMDRAISVLDKTYNDVVSGGLGLNSIFDNIELIVASFKSFLSSPLFSKCKEKNDHCVGLHSEIVQSAERLLKTLAKLYEGCSGYTKNLNAEEEVPELSEIHYVHGTVPSQSSSMILDMELDTAGGVSDVSSSTNSVVNKKLAFLSIISSFISILPSVTWEILFNLKEKESDPEILESILLSLCQHPYWYSSSQLLDLITSITENVNVAENLKLQCSHMLSEICSLLESLLRLDVVGKPVASSSSSKPVFEECLMPLGDLVHKVCENSCLDWRDRAQLVNCICNFLSLRPQIAQSLIEKLLSMLQDPDYRVRFCLARRIGILFQTWEGHVELFQDVCSNFGTKLVSFSKEKVVQADEVLAAGPQPRPFMETTIITLMHLGFQSEKIELETVFILCVVAAIEPCQRELVRAVLESLSNKLSYTNRAKYLEEIMGPILFSWVTCGVSLVALVEARDIFVFNVEPINFVQYCCQWLVPALILDEDYSNLKWVAKVAGRSCAELVKHHFVHIFSVCMALHCRKKAGRDKGSRALETSILRIAEISEHDRDELIKKCMVSIVNHIFSLASNVADPPLPFFSKTTVAATIRTVVDGFLDSEDLSRNINLVDKIQIFRPDRVFMFIVEIHYKVAAAACDWHKRNHLAGIEVLVDLLGCRAALPSTFGHLMNHISMLHSVVCVKIFGI